ncbi:DUF397 domain-containing protein [Streptomyces sp. SID1034]|uniref:DUF397 domain-containing protein n=1 Tax=Streptomyces TaxID=1883 RepID=UPI00136C3D0D|nr:DUF397 domain-containing protein [Streptomyces sp. SID1034]MYV92129.1 DUF397 domain-containing protein [Streptomyces sp. SID1034]
MNITRSLAAARWRKSSYSNAEGGSCVEVAEGAWRKSSYSNADGGSCVEVAAGLGDVVPVRDSKVAAGPVLVVGAGAWARFVGAVKAS